ncbi:MAG: hypothetical protein QOF51_418 [Chloroflexota bacterium]|jgi:predicted thioesterase|nr:hypothetical protein [Chloroflexota bacterium]
MEPSVETIANQLTVGAAGEAQTVVTEEQLAFGRGVLSTPSMIDLMERSAIAAVDAALPQGWTTVGYEVCIRHLAPTALGVEVLARAELLGIEGRRLTFRVEASNPTRLIGEGTHQRVIVDLSRLQGRAAGGAPDATEQH